MREVLDQLIREHGLDINALAILRSEKTSSSIVRYRIALDVCWGHWPGSDDGDSTAVSGIPPIHPGLLGTWNGVPFEVQ